MLWYRNASKIENIKIYSITLGGIMKSLYNGFLICMSTFSVVPVKRAEWNDENMKYVFCFFPLIGVLIGSLEYLWFYFCSMHSVSHILYSAVATIIPVLITGGIHIDGLIDTFDAIFCYGDVDKRLNVLKDSRVGAFGVIYTLMYFIVVFGLYESISHKYLSLSLLISVYAISRVTSGLITINFPQSKDSGLQKSFTENKSVTIVNAVLIVWLVCLLHFISFELRVAFVIAGLLFYTWVYYFSKKLIGGLAGDLIGFSLSLFEALMLIIVVAVPF